MRYGLRHSFASLYLSHQVPEITDITPSYGPQIGGTRITVSGPHLGAGMTRQIYLGEKMCTIQRYYNNV